MDDITVAPGITFPNTFDGRTHLAGAVIIDPAGRAFPQRRSPTRKICPNCWAVLCGHADAGETMLQGLAREIHEAPGWRLRTVEAQVLALDWDPGGGLVRHDV